MARNVEIIQKQFGSVAPLPSIELADNALKLGGIKANLYALKTDLNGEVEVLLSNIQEVIDALEEHKDDDVRHLTPDQIAKIQDAINATQALNIANSAINSAKASIEAEAVQSAVAQAKQYTDAELQGKQDTLTFDNTPTENSTNPVTSDGIFKAIQNKEQYTDPVTGETVDQPLNEALTQNPQTRVNPEYFYRFKNMIDNSSFEVFDGVTLLPLGWDAGEVSADASIFGTHSLKLTSGVTAKMTSKFQPDYSWLYPNTYNARDCVLCFYHKHNAVRVKIYDVENEEYLPLTALSSTLEESVDTGTAIEYDDEVNWSQYRCMVKFTPPTTAGKLRVEFTGLSGSYSATLIDAPMLEPYVPGEFPSIYKDGRYSTSAYQILNPPPADVDRFTDLGHFSVANSLEDENHNIYYQELLRSDGSLAIKRQASNPDTNGYYQTIVETFYKANGTTVNYVDTWSFTYTDSGAILTSSKTSTED